MMMIKFEFYMIFNNNLKEIEEVIILKKFMDEESADVIFEVGGEHQEIPFVLFIHLALVAGGDTLHSSTAWRN